jgi:hypothetical protein
MNSRLQVPRQAGRLCGLLVLGALTLGVAGDSTPLPQQTVIAELQPQQYLIGQWRGVGQVRRGSAQGAWQETGAAVWELTKDRTGIRWTATDGKLWKAALLTVQPGDRPLVLLLTLPDDAVREYRGQRDGDRLVFESAADSRKEVHRATFTPLGENRVTVLFEKRGEQQSFYQRVAEIGFQRAGTRLAATDGNGPECVVTGGLGTIAVTHNGQTYYVCCTGCRDAFNDDPQGILAAWAERQRKKSSM